jgi:hypothetical protein
MRRKQLLMTKSIDITPNVENTCWKYPFVFWRNRNKEESKKGCNPVKLFILRQGTAPEK